MTDRTGRSGHPTYHQLALLDFRGAVVDRTPISWAGIDNVSNALTKRLNFSTQCLLLGLPDGLLLPLTHDRVTAVPRSQGRYPHRVSRETPYGAWGLQPQCSPVGLSRSSPVLLFFPSTRCPSSPSPSRFLFSTPTLFTRPYPIVRSVSVRYDHRVTQVTLQSLTLAFGSALGVGEVAK